MGLLDGKVALVTGAGRGIGRATARLFAREGAAVALLSRSPAPLDEAVNLIKAEGGRAVGIQCDVLQLDAVGPAINKAAEAFGTIDILVNNAHDMSMAQKVGQVATATVAQLENQFRSGPIASVVALQTCLPYMKRAGWGRVINVASGVGVRGIANFLPYAMAKEALRSATRVAARELAPFGVTVNAVCPAADTETSRETIASGVLGNAAGATPARRMGQPDEDIAPILLFLAGPESHYITGYTYMADGGSNIDAAR